jgi:hypothetical protein
MAGLGGAFKPLKTTNGSIIKACANNSYLHKALLEITFYSSGASPTAPEGLDFLLKVWYNKTI